MTKRAPLLRRLLDLAPFLLLAVLVIVFGLIDQRTLSSGNLINVLAQATPILVLALGAHIVLLTAGIDLSAGVGVAFCAVLIAGRLDAGDPLLLALAVGAGAMILLGLVNGALVGLLHVPPFVATLATMVALQGATLEFARAGVLIVDVPLLKAFGMGHVAGLPWTIVFAALVALGTWVMMRWTRFGLRTYALGSDPAAAQLAGVRFARQQITVYIVAALFTFLAAVVIIGRTPVVTPNLGGTSLLLDAIAAAVIGGTSIFGGRGTVGGVVAGAIIVSLLTTALRVFGVDPSGIDLFKGMIIVIALCGDAGIDRLRRWMDFRTARR